jgi:hypothetical protein
VISKIIASSFLLKIDSDGEVEEEIYVKELANSQPQGTSKIPKFLSSALKGLPERY